MRPPSPSKRPGRTSHSFSRTASDLESLKSELRMPADSLFREAGDVAFRDTVKGFLARCVEKFGRVDVLINSAGMHFRKPLLELTAEEWRTVMNVNLGSTVSFCQEAGRHMVAQKSGKLVNMASVVGTLALPDLSGHRASQGGIISLVKALAVEWAKQDVNVIAPGFCETSYTENFTKKTELCQMLLDKTPHGRWGEFPGYCQCMPLSCLGCFKLRHGRGPECRWWLERMMSPSFREYEVII